MSSAGGFIVPNMNLKAMTFKGHGAIVGDCPG